MSQAQVEHELFKQMDLTKEQSAEPEWLEAQKRNKVITVKDLTETAEARGYLTAQEIQDNIGGMKATQAYARATNDILIGWQMPLRKEKQQLIEAHKAQIEAVTDAEEKNKAIEAFQEQMRKPELTVWLKDFPRTVADFKEMRRSAAQHYPELDMAIHGTILIEELFERSYDEEPEVIEGAELTAEQQREIDEERARFEREEFPTAERQQAYKDLMYINRYAQNCPATSQMRCLVPHRLLYKGPDPPPEGWEIVEEPEPPVLTGKAPAKGKPVEPVPVQEVEKSPEVEAADKTVRKFSKLFMETLQELQADLNEYR